MKIAVVGAGLIGRLTALACAMRNWQVTVYDSRSLSDKTSCSFTAAGMLSPYCELAHSQAVVHQLGLRSLALWSELSGQLKSSVFFQTRGTLVVAPSSEGGELRHFKEKVRRKLRQLDSDAGALNDLTPSAMHGLEPSLDSACFDGLFVSNEGQIDSGEILQALRLELVERQAIWQEDSFVQVAPNVVTNAGASEHFDHVFDCRGLGAKTDDLQLRGVRGELIVVRAPFVELSRPVRMLHSRYPLYVVPRPGKIFILGATSIESEDASAISVQSILELLSSAVSLHPGFLDATVVETRVNCRPAFDDNVPRVCTQNGLTSINGLYRHGYLCGPAVVEIAVQLVAGDPLYSSAQSICRRVETPLMSRARRI